MRFGCSIVVLLLSMMIPALAQEANPVSVPVGTAPTLDGTLSTDEWADALSVPLAPEATLFLKRADEFLYLAVRATTMGVPSPMIVRGEEVRVLHASAALGTAIYAQDGDHWTLQQGFTWQCRATGFSTYAVAARDQFLEQEHWLATIGRLGEPTEFEYKILWDEEPLQMLFLFLEVTDPLQLLSWPVAPELAAPYLEIITGPIPENLVFDFDDWAVLLPAGE